MRCLYHERRGSPASLVSKRSMAISFMLMDFHCSGESECEPLVADDKALSQASALFCSVASALSKGAKFRNGGTGFFGGAKVGRLGSETASKTPSSMRVLSSVMESL